MRRATSRCTSTVMTFLGRRAGPGSLVTCERGVRSARRLKERSSLHQALYAIYMATMPLLYDTHLPLAELHTTYSQTNRLNLRTWWRYAHWTTPEWGLGADWTVIPASAFSHPERKEEKKEDLELVSRAPLCCGLFAQFTLSQAIRSWNVTIFYANTSRHAMTFTFDPLTLKVCGRSSVTWSWSVVNMIEIEQSPAELFMILQTFAPVTSPLWPWRLTPWPWIFVILRASCVQTVQNMSEVEQSAAELSGMLTRTNFRIQCQGQAKDLALHYQGQGHCFLKAFSRTSAEVLETPLFKTHHDMIITLWH